MLTSQDLALTIHRNSVHGQYTVRDSDLGRLMELWPDLRAVFEEVQYLRCRTEDLEAEVEALRHEKVWIGTDICND